MQQDFSKKVKNFQNFPKASLEWGGGKPNLKPPLKGEVARSAGGVPKLVKVRPLAGTPQPRSARQPPFQGSR